MPRLHPIRGAEIVLAAAGGPPTIDFPDIPALLDAVQPRLIVPMHYKTPKINLNIQPLSGSSNACPACPSRCSGGRGWTSTAETLPASRRIVVLDHGR